MKTRIEVWIDIPEPPDGVYSFDRLRLGAIENLRQQIEDRGWELLKTFMGGKVRTVTPREIFDAGGFSQANLVEGPNTP